MNKLGKIMPAIGSTVKTPDGEGEVMENNMIKESVKVKVNTKNDEFELMSYSIHDVELISGKYEYSEDSEDETEDIKIEADDEEDSKEMENLLEEEKNNSKPSTG